MPNSIDLVIKSKDIFLSDRSTRDAKWDGHRANTQIIEGIYASNEKYKKQSGRMAVCSETLLFRENINQQTGVIGLKLKEAYFCQLRFCPVCTWRKAMKNSAKFVSKIPDLQERYPNHRWLFLTLTVKNPPLGELRSKLKEMNKAWNNFIRRDFPAVGWIRSVEVSKGEVAGHCHPHFHVMLMVPAAYFKGAHYITRDKWLERWQKAMKDDSITQVDIRVIKPKKEGDSSLHSAAAELIKYTTKAGELITDPEFLFAMTDQLYGARLIATGGVFKGLLKNEMSNQELIEGEDPSDQPEDDNDPPLIFGWKRKIKRYTKRN